MTGLATGACTSDSPDDPSGTASTSAPPVDADQELVDDVAARLSSAMAIVALASEASQRQAARLAGLRRLHAAHLEALGGPGEWFAYEQDSPTRAEVLRAEARLQRFLATAAVRAESGTLAKLLASMSAGVAQHLEVIR